MRLIIILLIIALNTNLAISAPDNITLQVGSSTIILSGTGFGAHANYAPTETHLNTAWTDFETWLDTDVWETNNAGMEMVVGGSIQRGNSSQNSRGRRTVGDFTNVFGVERTGTYPFTLFHTNDTAAEVLFISGWYALDADYMTQMAASRDVSQCKLISTRSVGDVNGNQYWSFIYGATGIVSTRMNWEDGRISNNPPELRWDGPTGNDVINALEWHRYDLQIDISKGIGVGAGYSVSKFYVDGKEYTDASNRNYLALPVDPSAYFVRYFADEGITGYVYLDDAFVDNTWARVEISDNATWDETTRNHLEIQIPTSWSDTSITVNINKGTFENDVQYYLYVKTAADEVNANGIPITFETDGQPVTIGTGEVISLIAGETATVY